MMKKIIILIVFALIYISNLNAFNGYIPATEISGEFMKFSTYYQKQHLDFENGFSDIGMIFTYPKIGKIFGVGGEFHSFGDKKYQRFETNVFFSIKPINCITTVVSAGLVARSFKDLIFMEEEELPQSSGNAFVAGISSNLNIQNRFNIGLGFYNLNKPNVSFLYGVDKLPMTILVNADAVIVNWLSVGAYLMREDEKNYYGLKLNFSLPVKNMHIEMGGSSEKKVSSYMVLNTFNYWNFKVGYEMYLESNLKSSGYSMFISKEIIGSLDAPIIGFPDNEWNKDYREVPIRDILLRFSVIEHDRLKNVKVLLNNRTVFEKDAIREYEKKDFSTNLKLRDGDNSLVISATGMNGKVTEKKISIYYKSSDIQIMPIAEEIYLGDDVDIVWESTVDDGRFGIYLYENDVEKVKLNADLIKDHESEEGTSKKYRYTWKVKEIQNGKEYQYKIRIKEFQLGLSCETNVFNGDITEPSIAIWNEEIEIPYINLAGRVEDKSDIKYVKVNGIYVDNINKASSKKWEFAYEGKLSIGDNNFIIEVEDIYGNKKQQVISKKRDYEYANIDRNIPVSKKKVPNRIGIILGIEDYDNIESAKYAIGDAEAVKNYFTKRLGIDKNNIYYLSENTKSLPQTIPIRSLFKTELKEKCNKIKKSFQNVEIIIYYSGHGLPDDEDISNFYLLPKDYNQKYEDTKISFSDDVLSELNKYVEDEDILVIVLDACFSGKKRGSDELIAYGAKPASLYITIQQAFNNMIMFSSSSGLQKSYSYDRAQHGLFTYAFLRALKEFDSISIKELANYIKTTTETISGIDEENIVEIQQPDVIPPELLERVTTTELGEVNF